MIVSGSNVYPDTLSVPDPNVPATNLTLSLPVSDLADRTTFLLTRMRAAQQTIRYECVDGDNITVGPVFGLVSFDTMPRYMQVPTETTLTTADIEGGIAPLGNAFYYIYLYWNAGPTFELSTISPDENRLYKSSGTDRVLVGIAQTEVTAKFSRVRALGTEVRYLVPPRVRNPSSTGPVPEIVDLTSKLPPIADVIGLTVEGLTTISVGTAFDPFVAVGPAEFDPVEFRKVKLPTGAVGGRACADIEVPIGHRPRILPDLGNDRKIAILTDATTSTLELHLTKYRY